MLHFQTNSRFTSTHITRIFFILIFGILAWTSYGQSENTDRNYNQLIYFEADPLAYINKGYSLHLGYENRGYRFDLTRVKVDFPLAFEEGFYGTGAFDLVTNIYGV